MRRRKTVSVTWALLVMGTLVGCVPSDADVRSVLEEQVAADIDVTVQDLDERLAQTAPQSAEQLQTQLELTSSPGVTQVRSATVRSPESGEVLLDFIRRDYSHQPMNTSLQIVVRECRRLEASKTSADVDWSVRSTSVNCAELDEHASR